MKRILLIFLLLIPVISLPGRAAEYDYTLYDGFTIPADPVLPENEKHPSLWFADEGIAALKQKRTADARTGRLWSALAQDPLLTLELPSPPSAGDDKTTVHKYYGIMSMLAQVNALVWLLSDDPAREIYKTRAIQALARAYDGPVYALDPKESGSPVDEIYLGTWAQNYCAAYDWLQAELTPEQDTAIRDRLARQATWISQNLGQWGPRPHNHLSKPAWGLGTLALTLTSHPEAKKWLAQALDASNRCTQHFFSGDGIYREGAHYLVFSAVNFVPFLYHYRNVAGVDGFAAFAPVFETVVATRNGKGWLPNIYDSYIKPFPSHWVAGPYMAHSTWLNPDAELGNVLQWAAQNTDFNAFGGKTSDPDSFNYTGATWDFALGLHDFLMDDPAVEPEPPTASPTVFLKGGQTVFRNNWLYHDPSTRYLLFHGVAETNNHFHYDHLSFIIQAENQMMASDSGYAREKYSEPTRKSWYLTAPAHNVVTADGSAPVDTAQDVTPVSRDSLDTAFFDFQEKEAPYPNGGLLKRAIAFPGENFFVVIDRLTAPKEAEFKLHLHGGRGVMTGEGHHRLWTYANDSYGPPAQLAAWVLSGPLTDQTGEVTYIKGDFAEFAYITSSQAAREALFMEILYPLAADAELPKTTDLSDSTRLAATVEKDGVKDLFISRRGGSGRVKAAGMEAEARFAWVRQKGKTKQWAMQEGSLIQSRGEEIISALTPVTAAGQIGPDGFETTVEAVTGCTLAFTVPQGKKIGTSTFNGKAVPVTLHEDKVSVALPGRGNLRIAFAP